MEFSYDTSDMDEDALFDSHYRLLRSLHQDSLVILDNFNVLPKNDAFFKEFVKNDFQLLVTTRCEVKQYASIKIKEIASEKDLLQLFSSHCPYSDDDNLVNMLILVGDLELALLVLNQYDALVTDNEGNNTLDYGCCRLAAGIIALKEGKPVEAEKNLLTAESIIGVAMDTSDSDSVSSYTAVSSYYNYASENDYLKSVYGYLNNLYARWHKPEKALEYKEKWLNARNQQNKNITHRKA